MAGINIQQRLTGNKGVRLYDYYGCAICKHAGDVGAMSNTIWTFLQMTLMQSEDDDRVRRTEPSSEDHTTTVMNASVNKRVRLALERDQHMVLDNSNILCDTKPTLRI